MRHFNFVRASNYSHDNITKQQTTVSLNAANLKFPYILKVGGTGLHLRGKILLNGSTIEQLNNSSKQLDIAPLLTTGKNIIEILGNYSPSSSSIQVEFSGYGTSISQQSSGNGTIEHVLIVNVY
jgi:hypothetical protein